MTLYSRCINTITEIRYVDKYQSINKLASSNNIFDISNFFGFLAIILAAVNIFGGFLVTQRMLQMYKKKKKDKK